MDGTEPRTEPTAQPGVLATVLWVTTAVLLVALVVTGIVTWRSLEATKDDVAELRRAQESMAQTQLDLDEAVGGVQAEQLADFDPTTLAEDLAPSVFMVHAPVDDLTESQGSAFVLGKDGRRSLLVTNQHVVADRWAAGSRDVLLTRGERDYEGTIVEIDAETDLALIEVEADLPVLEPASASPQVGNPVMVIGSGLGLDGTVTTGIVSALDRDIDGRGYLQVSAQINPGNSGGPVFDADGGVLGVATLKLVSLEIEGVGFAIPIDVVCARFELC